MSFDKKKLFTPRLPEADVEVPGVGTFRVRALNRAEVMAFQKMAADGADAASVERRLLSIALVDPKLTEDEVGQWQEASLAGELEPITDKVTELSGLDDGAAKEAVKEFHTDPELRFPVQAGEGSGNDGGPASADG